MDKAKCVREERKLFDDDERIDDEMNDSEVIQQRSRIHYFHEQFFWNNFRPVEGLEMTSDEIAEALAEDPCCKDFQWSP